MNNTQTPKKVMPEDIDKELIKRIEEETDVLDRESIAEVLTWIANNPIEPTAEQMIALYENWKGLPGSEYNDREFYYPLQFQKIAFLKQEPILPEDVRKLLIPIGGQPADSNFTASLHNEKIIAAWKIGAGIK